MVYEIKCKFCDKVNGTITFPDNIYIEKDALPGLAGIADSRCDECKKEHGSYEKIDRGVNAEIKNKE